MTDPDAPADAIPRTRRGLAALLESRGLRLRRRHGQNFLVEPALAEAIVADAGVGRGDHVVEIGPGAGALTVPLLARAGLVTAVEIDRGLHALLAERLGREARLRLVHGDCLDGEGGLHPAIASALAGPRGAGIERVLVVANLPYSVGTEVVVRLLAADRPPDAVTVMLQREVLERLAARTGGGDYGPLAVLSTLAAEIRPLRRVPRTAFLPQPEVESVVLRVEPARLDAARRRAVAGAVALARRAFQKRRKTLANALGGRVPPESFAAAAVDPSLRPEDVPPEGWVRLAVAIPADAL